MGRNALVILVLLTLALGGGALYVLGDSAGTCAGSSVASSGTAPAALGAPLLPQLKAAEVAPENKEKRDKACAEETKRFTDRIAREKALAPFTVMMAKAKFDDLLKKREALLAPEQKDAKPAAKK